MTAVFDGHNDVLYRLWSSSEENRVQNFLAGNGQGQLDMPRMRAGSMSGGLFAIFAPSSGELPDNDDELNPPPAASVTQAKALQATLDMARLLTDFESASAGSFLICRNVTAIRSAIAGGSIAAVMHIEGAEAIDRDMRVLDQLYDMGLRSIGLVWSRPNIFGHGVPFRFPSNGDTGPGLTAAGKALIRRCNDKRIAIDLSHLNEKGFWDVAELSRAPLVASHSNCLAICASSRNLSDDQLRAIGRSRGLVGLNFANGFLREDGRWSGDTSVELMLRHLDHMLKLAGEDCVGLGSDYDGARIPDAIGDVAGLPVLIDAMRAHGYGEALIAKIAGENWLRVLEETWGS
jgi:membrane dipeptidase